MRLVPHDETLDYSLTNSQMVSYKGYFEGSGFHFVTHFITSERDITNLLQLDFIDVTNKIPIFDVAFKTQKQKFMLRGLLPKEGAFFDYFDQLMDVNKNISRTFLEMVEGKQSFESASTSIKKMEREADRISRVCLDLLHRTFITPIDRDDIFNLVKCLDGFADNINSSAYRFANYGVEEVRNETFEFAKVIIAAVDALDVAMHGLKNIKKNDQVMREKCVLIHDLEDESDEINRKAVAALFSQNDVMMLLKWKSIFERMERAVDRLNHAANIIETVIIEQS